MKNENGVSNTEMQDRSDCQKAHRLYAPLNKQMIDVCQSH